MYFWKNGSSGTKGICVSILGFASTESSWTGKLTFMASCGYRVISECAKLFQQPLSAIHPPGKGIFCWINCEAPESDCRPFCSYWQPETSCKLSGYFQRQRVFFRTGNSLSTTEDSLDPCDSSSEEGGGYLSCILIFWPLGSFSFIYLWQAFIYLQCHMLTRPKGLWAGSGLFVYVIWMSLAAEWLGSYEHEFEFWQTQFPISLPLQPWFTHLNWK